MRYCALANYVVTVDLGQTDSPMKYLALNRSMGDCGFVPQNVETLTPAEFSINSPLSLEGIKRMVEDLIKAEFQPDGIEDADIRKVIIQLRP
jgi:hypothetical protein